MLTKIKKMKLSKRIHKAHIEFDIDKRKEIGYIITYNQFEELEALEKQVEEFKKGITSALRIKDLWLISDKNCLLEHESEAQVLCKMRDTFLRLLDLKK